MNDEKIFHTWKIYIRGNSSRPDLVLDRLLSYGGIGSKTFKYNDEKLLYYIKKDRTIAFLPNRTEDIKYLKSKDYFEVKPELWRVYIKGVAGRGDEIIKLLEEYGGELDFNWTGELEDSYYYINKERKISSSPDIWYLKQSGYSEIFLDDEKNIRYCLQGSSDNGEEVIQTLIDEYGGINSLELKGNQEDIFYYVDVYGTIDYIVEDYLLENSNYQRMEQKKKINKVYIQGNKKNASKVIRTLIDEYGANPDTLLTGDNDACFYNIDSDNRLSVFPNETYFLVNGYKPAYINGEKPKRFFMFGDEKRGSEILLKFVSEYHVNNLPLVHCNDKNKLYFVDLKGSLCEIPDIHYHHLIDAGFEEMSLDNKEYPKVYYKGNEYRYKDILSILISLGGSNALNNVKCNDPYMYYYIDSYGNISSTLIKSDLKGYLEGNLIPPKVYIRGNGYKIIDELIKQGAENSENLCGDGIGFYFIDDNNKIKFETNEHILKSNGYTEIHKSDGNPINKIYIRGNKEHYNIIKNTLLSYGGKQTELNCHDEHSLFYIKSDKTIGFINVIEEDKLKNDGYREVSMYGDNRVYIKFTRKYTNEIISVLTNIYKGKPSAIMHNETKCLYIDSDNFIRHTDYNQTKLLKSQGYREIFIEDYLVNCKKIYIIGDKENGDNVIKTLESFGGKNLEMLRGSLSYKVYYINNVGVIVSVSETEIQDLNNDGYAEYSLTNKTGYTSYMMQGDFDRSSEIIAELVKHGGKNSNGYICTSSDRLYVIDRLTGVICKYETSARNYLENEGCIELFLEDSFKSFERVIVLTKKNKWKLDFYSHKDLTGKHICMYNENPKEVIKFDESKLGLLSEKTNRKIK